MLPSFFRTTGIAQPPIGKSGTWATGQLKLWTAVNNLGSHSRLGWREAPPSWEPQGEYAAEMLGTARSCSVAELVSSGSRERTGMPKPLPTCLFEHVSGYLQLYRCMASQARVADCINYLQ